MRRAWQVLTSLRTAALAMTALGVLLLLSVTLPQRQTLGEEAFAEMVASNPAAAFVLSTLGLGNVASSPVFLAVLGLLFVVLTAVIVDRIRATLRRVRFLPPAAATLRARAASDAAVVGPVRPGWLKATRTVLAGFGYEAETVAEDAVWGVKHRRAALGFPLFHVSFFLLLVGGGLIFFTRGVTATRLVEGQELASAGLHVLRQPRWGRLPELRLLLTEVSVAHERGEVTELAASLAGPGGSQAVRVNHPARYGATSILVTGAGLAPSLWLQDEAGFTLDRVAVAVEGPNGSEAVVPLAGSRVRLTLSPLPLAGPLPNRAELATTEVAVAATGEGLARWSGTLRPGERVALGPFSLVLEEVRYWAELRAVTERGGGWLASGFALGVSGLVWRLVWHRREIAVTLRGDMITIHGRSELYHHRFAHEVAAVAEVLRTELEASS